MSEIKVQKNCIEISVSQVDILEEKNGRVCKDDGQLPRWTKRFT